MVHHLWVVAGLDHSMKDEEHDITADGDGHTATTVAEPPAEKKEWRLPRNSLDKELAEQLVARAKADGVSLVGPDGLLSGIVGQILETAFEVEMTEELGYERHERTDSLNSRNGPSPKTVHTDVGAVTIDVPRDRDGSFDPVIVPKHTRRR